MGHCAARAGPRITPWAVTATRTIWPRSSTAFDGARSPERRNGATDRALWTSLPPTAGPCRGWARSLLEDETVLPIGTGEMNLKEEHNHQLASIYSDSAVAGAWLPTY
jgi:hypothetical protein